MKATIWDVIVAIKIALTAFISETSMHIQMGKFTTISGEQDHLIKFHMNLGFVLMIILALIIHKHWPWR